MFLSYYEWGDNGTELIGLVTPPSYVSYVNPYCLRVMAGCWAWTPSSAGMTSLRLSDGSNKGWRGLTLEQENETLWHGNVSSLLALCE